MKFIEKLKETTPFISDANIRWIFEIYSIKKQL
jgi:hypothetical protein